MLRTVVAGIYTLVWGIALLVTLIRDKSVPAEYWTVPAIGLGAIMGVLGSIEKRKPEKPESEPPDDATAKEGAK